MRIVYIYDTIAIIGGIERIFVDKMNYLAEKSHHEVYLLTSSQGNHPVSFPLSKQVKHIDLAINFHSQYRYSYPKRFWLRIKMNSLFRRRVQETIDKIDPDFIISTTVWKPSVVCKLKGRAKKIIESHCARAYTPIPLTHTMGFVKDKLNEWAAYRQFKVIEKHCDAIVALTQADAKAWKKAIHVYTIPNFTNYILPRSSKCEFPRVIAVGRLVAQKGFDNLISAWKIVNKQFPEWKLDIFGEGIYRERLNKQIADNHLTTTITIHPFSRNILQEYVNSSILALSSNYEGFGLVLIEAMGCGLPCVSFDCPQGPSEIIKDKEDGFLIKSGDIEGFAKAICYLIENEEERKLFGSRARKNVKRYSPEMIMPQWEQLFNTLLEK